MTGTAGSRALVLATAGSTAPARSTRADGASADDVRRRRLPVVGKGRGVFSFIHVDDAADATVAAVEGGAPGIFNVVDDEPAPAREWLPVYAEAARGEAAPAGAAFDGPLVAPEHAGGGAPPTLRGASNATAKAEPAGSRATRAGGTGFRDELR